MVIQVKSYERYKVKGETMTIFMVFEDNQPIKYIITKGGMPGSRKALALKLAKEGKASLILDRYGKAYSVEGLRW